MSDRSETKGIKVFSATMAQERARLGEDVTAWLEKSKVSVVDVVVTQSSDNAFHCITVTVLYK